MYSYHKSMAKIIKSVNTPEDFKLSHPSKISIKDRCAFSVPAGPKFACPGATKACNNCYAQKGRHVFPNVQSVMAHNWKLLKKFERYNQKDQAVRSIIGQLRKDAEIFRIYESGDFTSKWTIDMWSKVINECKNIRFWAYTRSFHLDFTNLTRNHNFVLWASTDQYNAYEAKQFVRRFKKSGTKHAYGPWGHNAEIPFNSFVCPAVNGTIEIQGACEKCMLCVIKKRVRKNVVFLQH